MCLNRAPSVFEGVAQSGRFPLPSRLIPGPLVFNRRETEYGRRFYDEQNARSNTAKRATFGSTITTIRISVRTGRFRDPGDSAIPGFWPLWPLKNRVNRFTATIPAGRVSRRLENARIACQTCLESRIASARQIAMRSKSHRGKHTWEPIVWTPRVFQRHRRDSYHRVFELFGTNAFPFADHRSARSYSECEHIIMACAREKDE